MKTPSRKKYRIGAQREHHARVSSTQDTAKQRAMHGCAEGLVVISDVQTHGRGQFQRQWSSNKGGLWFSFVLRPNVKPDAAQRIAPAVAAAIIDVLERYVADGKKENMKKENMINHVPTFTVKLPNDIMACVDGKWKKVCGILTESSITDQHVDWIAIGIGINVHNRLPASLRETACTLDEVYGITHRVSKMSDFGVQRANNYLPLQSDLQLVPLLEQLLQRINEYYVQFLVRSTYNAAAFRARLRIRLM